MGNESENIDLLADSFQKLEELRNKVLFARGEYDEELAFARRLAERSNRQIPDQLLLNSEEPQSLSEESYSATQSNRSPASPYSIAPGEFFNKSLTEATRIFVERMSGIASWPTIVTALQKGGFKGLRTEAEIKQARLNILKSTTFVLIPDNMFGLVSIYGGKKKSGRPKKE